MTRSVRLVALPGTYAVARLDAASPIPGWADGAGFVSISRSEDELSIVCLEERVPAGTRMAGGWSCFRFVGPFAFGETGIVASVIAPLSAAGIGIFVVSTFDGDHLLVSETEAARSRLVLEAAGHVVM